MPPTTATIILFMKRCPAFLYAMGKSGRYHHASDTLELLSLGGYTGLFKLITAYINLYNQP